MKIKLILFSFFVISCAGGSAKDNIRLDSFFKSTSSYTGKDVKTSNDTSFVSLSFDYNQLKEMEESVLSYEKFNMIKNKYLIKYIDTLVAAEKFNKRDVCSYSFNNHFGILKFSINDSLDALLLASRLLPEPDGGNLMYTLLIYDRKKDEIIDNYMVGVSCGSSMESTYIKSKLVFTRNKVTIFLVGSVETVNMTTGKIDIYHLGERTIEVIK